MNCRECFSTQSISYRQRHKLQKNMKQQPRDSKKQTPFAMKLLNSLGLRQYIFNKFVFRKVQPKYQFLPNSILSHLPQFQTGKTESLSIISNQFYFIGKNEPVILEGYDIYADVIDKGELSIPILTLKLKQQNGKNKPFILYSHGNSSDITDAYSFFTRLVKSIPFNIIIYDYTGYGISKKGETTQQTLVKDIEELIKYLIQRNVKPQQIILWGFSLGTYPTVSIASKYQFAGVVLQSPIASAAYFFERQGGEGENVDDGVDQYQLDCLDNVASVGQIQGQILIMHSTADQIIPVSHSYKLYNKIKKSRKTTKFALLQVQKLSHNQMHYVLADEKQNSLNIHFRQFMQKMQVKVSQLFFKQQQTDNILRRDKLVNRFRNSGNGQRKEIGLKSKDKVIRMKMDDFEIEEEEEQHVDYHELRPGVKNNKNYFGKKQQSQTTTQTIYRRPKLKVSSKLDKQNL